jgi:hypothetical protein
MTAKRFVLAAVAAATLGASAACGSTTGPSALDEPFDNPPVAPTDTSGMMPPTQPLRP